MTHPIPDAALDDRLGFLGMTGSGKTFGAGTCVERILAKRGRVIIPDPLGVWWGLRQSSDGQVPSPYEIVIFGGPHADLPLTPGAGAIIGETVAGMRESAIVDLSQFETAASERRFMLAFLDALYRRSSGEPVHLVFDEADLWAPERIVDKEGEATKLHGIMQTVVRRGRIKGLTSWLISQRPAALSKNVLSQVDGLIAFRLTASQDRKALGLWIEGQADRDAGKAILGRLPEKKQGEAVVWLPGRGVLADVMFPPKLTYDSSRAPKRGEKRRHVDLKPLDLGALKERLATVEQEAKANNPQALKKRIAELERQAAISSAPSNEAAKITTAEREAEFEAGFEAGYQEGVQAAAARVKGFVLVYDAKAMIGSTKVIETADKHPVGDLFASEILSLLDGAPAPAKRPAQNVAPRQARSTLPAQPLKLTVDSAAGSQAPRLGAERKPLIVLASAYPGGLTEAQWATIAGFKRTGGTWGTYKGRLRTAGLVEQRGNLWHATEAGLEAIGGAPPAPSTTKERLAMWQAALGGGPSKILDELVSRYPQGLARDLLAELVGMTASGGTFGTYLSRLSSNGLIERDGAVITASAALFE